LTIQHDSPISAIALSRDERFLACGGTDTVPITIWDLAQETLVARLSGLNHQAHALAFSSDSTRLAAANLWGGLCVWDVAHGQLLQIRPETKSRRIRSLVYPATAKAAQLPVMLSDPIHSQVKRALAPNGALLAINQAAVRIFQYRTRIECGTLSLSNYTVAKSGLGMMAWSAESNYLALSGDGWAGVWEPCAHDPQFYARDLPFPGGVDGLAVLSTSRRIVYAHGRMIAMLDMPQEPLRTTWQEFMHRVPDPSIDPSFRATRSWQWNTTQWGYDGVHTHEGCLVWFSHSYNPHAGGGAATQSFASFLADGPTHAIPEPVLRELCQAVRELVRLT
jgi:PAS domain-containing protein